MTTPAALGYVSPTGDDWAKEGDNAITTNALASAAMYDSLKLDATAKTSAAVEDAAADAAAKYTPKPAVSGLAVPALMDWFAALQAQATETVQVIALGDSITEGVAATRFTSRWVNLLQKYLRQAYGADRGATHPFIPAVERTDMLDRRATIVGDYVASKDYGFGWRTAVMQNETSKITFTFTGTSAAVMFVMSVTTGKFDVSIDGAAPTTVDTNQGAGFGNNGATWNTGPLTRGPHTVTVTRNPGSTYHPYIQGLLTWDGDETHGIRIIEAAHSGYRASTITDFMAGSTGAALKGSGGAQLALIALGVNDTITADGITNYKANILRIVQGLRTAGGFTGPIVLINWWKINTLTEDEWAPYGDVLAQIAAEDQKIVYLDMRRKMPDIPTPYTAPEGFGYYADGIHPSDRGHKHIADKVTEYLANGR